MTGNWAGSNRRDTLPPNWHKVRAVILRRDGHRCTWRIGQGATCGKPATDVDHVKRNGGDHPDNLRSLCAKHHAQKSSAEGHRAKAEQAARRKRPVERHPGLR
jgi:hypothetical protein